MGAMASSNDVHVWRPGAQAPDEANAKQVDAASVSEGMFHVLCILDGAPAPH
jgi:hypothetical protein